MSINLPYNFQNLNTSSLSDAKDSNNDVTGKAVPASYFDSNFEELAKVMTVASSAPTASYAGQLWLDTSFSPKLLKQWDGTSWIAIGAVTIGATEPASPFSGLPWLDTSVSPPVLKVYDGTSWQSKVSYADSATNADNATNATNATNADNADTVDNFHASQTPTANTIPVADSSGKLNSGWLLSSSVITKTAGYDIQASEVNNKFQANVSTANTWSLPAANAVPSGSEIMIENIGAGTVTISTAIEGVTNLPLGTGWTINLYSDGSAWRIKSYSSEYNQATVAGTAFTLASAETERSTTSTSYVKMKEFVAAQNGVVTVYFEIKTSSGSAYAFGRVYKNGIAYGTERGTASTTYVGYSENLTFAAGDLIQIYLKINNASYAAYIRNAKVTSGGMVFNPISEQVNLD